MLPPLLPILGQPKNGVSHDDPSPRPAPHHPRGGRAAIRAIAAAHLGVLSHKLGIELLVPFVVTDTMTPLLVKRCHVIVAGMMVVAAVALPCCTRGNCYEEDQAQERHHSRSNHGMRYWHGFASFLRRTLTTDAEPIGSEGGQLGNFSSIVLPPPPI